jgi:hypothetical protein
MSAFPLTPVGHQRRLRYCGQGEEVAVKRLLLIASWVAALSAALPAALQADPGGPNLQQPVLLTCTGGLQVPGNPGTFTNRGRVVWAIDSTSVFVDAYFAITDGTDTFVIYDSKQGLKNLIACTADLGGGFSAIAEGFFTPR